MIPRLTSSKQMMAPVRPTCFELEKSFIKFTSVANISNLGPVVKFFASLSYGLKHYKKKLQIFDINTLITPQCKKSPTWTIHKNLQEKASRKTCVLDSHQAQEKNSGQISLVYVV